MACLLASYTILVFVALSCVVCHVHTTVGTVKLLLWALLGQLSVSWASHIIIVVVMLISRGAILTKNVVGAIVIVALSTGNGCIHSSLIDLNLVVASATMLIMTSSSAMTRIILVVLVPRQGCTINFIWSI